MRHITIVHTFVVAALTWGSTNPAHADCCGFDYGSCTAREHTLPQCQQGTQIVDGDVANLLDCWTLGFIAINPTDPLTYLIALAAGELYCDGAGNRTCVATLSDAECTDSDGDGLLDDWETNGVDVDGDGTIDVDLASFGANPNHKDLFLELDVMTGEEPGQNDMLRIKEAFASAPTNVGGTPNPDGTAGVHIWIDTGTLADSAASEDGAAPGSCGDGTDNGGDGRTDGDDPDCLVGDDLGGGNALPASDICNLNASFYNTKTANFDAARAQVFRYAISARGCDADGDGNADSGGWGEIDGNDFIEYNHDGGTIMHELGHTLGLQHGGDVSANCKPNYVSVMNYDLQFRINQRGGGFILDYSPPRFAGGRGTAVLPTLMESALDESSVLDSTDPDNRFVYVNAAGAKVQAQLSDNPNWNADGDPPLESSLAVNIDTSDPFGHPASCTNASTTGILTGHDDWSVVSLPFTQFGDSADGGVNVDPHPDPTLNELYQLDLALNTTDLRVLKTVTVDPAVAGTLLGYQITVANLGPNPASEIVVWDTLPQGTQLASAGDGCTEGPLGTLTCRLPELLAGETLSWDVNVFVERDLVYRAGGPVSIANSCSAENQRGPDLNYTDNAVDREASVVAVADLGVEDLSLQQAPSQVLAGTPFDVLFSETLTSGGPSSPMDVRTEAWALAPDGSSAAAQTPSAVEPALTLGEARARTELFTLVCGAPGSQTFSFATSVQPLSAADTDPNPANDASSASHTVDCVVPVAVNINPHRANNAIELQGAIEVEVLTTTAGEYGLPLPFDAAQIDPVSVHFGTRQATWEGVGGATPHQGWYRITRSYELDDETRDADDDMLLKFQGPDTGLTEESTEACVIGEYAAVDGLRYQFYGCAPVVLLE